MSSKRIRNVVLGISVAGLIAVGSLPAMAENTGAKGCGGEKSRTITSEQTQNIPSTEINKSSLTKGKVNGKAKIKAQQSPANKGGLRADDAPAEDRVGVKQK
jgi:hypothetical protein